MSERSTFWLSHLSAIEAEGITTKAYAEREGLSPQALYQWRKRHAGIQPGRLGAQKRLVVRDQWHPGQPDL